MLNDITIGKCDVISTLFGREEKILYKEHIVHCSDFHRFPPPDDLHNVAGTHVIQHSSYILPRGRAAPSYTPERKATQNLEIVFFGTFEAIHHHWTCCQSWIYPLEYGILSSLLMWILGLVSSKNTF